MHPDLPLDQILIGDCRELTKRLPDESVNCVVTSPPYWGLRSYGTDPQVWANGHEPCIEHQWVDATARRVYSERTAHTENTTLGAAKAQDGRINASQGNTCSICGAWRGELGLEPTPELYVAHLVEIFRECRRVLRDDGSLWLNLGDSYVGGKGANNHRWSVNHLDRETLEQEHHHLMIETGRPCDNMQNMKQSNLKPKDLVGIPWMVAFALRADGYYLRSDIIWAKPNPMPESVTDRPTKAHEYIFLLSKSQKYYYDADAVREPMQPATADRARYTSKRMNFSVNQAGQHHVNAGMPSAHEDMIKFSEAGRNRRTVWTVATHPLKQAHFATFPPKLIEPCILAGCPVGGVVLDPFMGSGTTASVCISLKRHYIGFDLNPAYVEDIAQDRADGTPPPLFVI